LTLRTRFLPAPGSAFTTSRGPLSSTYRARLLEKFMIENNAELIHYAIKEGLFD
jgi:hypothetical protein